MKLKEMAIVTSYAVLGGLVGSLIGACYGLKNTLPILNTDNMLTNHLWGASFSVTNLIGFSSSMIDTLPYRQSEFSWAGVLLPSIVLAIPGVYVGMKCGYQQVEHNQRQELVQFLKGIGIFQGGNQQRRDDEPNARTALSSSR